jgi:hypothetical protein
VRKTGMCHVYSMHTPFTVSSELAGGVHTEFVQYAMQHVCFRLACSVRASGMRACMLPVCSVEAALAAYGFVCTSVEVKLDTGLFFIRTKDNGAVRCGAVR